MILPSSCRMCLQVGHKVLDQDLAPKIPTYRQVYMLTFVIMDKRLMDHIAHLSHLGPCMIFSPINMHFTSFCPTLSPGVMILYYVRKLSWLVQWFLRRRFQTYLSYIKTGGHDFNKLAFVLRQKAFMYISTFLAQWFLRRRF
jgi:hypothetical protein